MGCTGHLWVLDQVFAPSAIPRLVIIVYLLVEVSSVTALVHYDKTEFALHEVIVVFIYAAHAYIAAPVFFELIRLSNDLGELAANQQGILR